MRVLPVLAIALLASVASAETGNDPTELQRTWANAVVYVPGSDKPRRIGVAALPDYLNQHENPRVVLYVHGCAGIGRNEHVAGRFHAALGYVFVAPDGFARRTKPVSCRPFLKQGGLHRAVLSWRQAEVRYSLRKLRDIPALTRAPLALVGHSEGGITVATIRTTPVTARVIEGWTCNAYWPEYEGLGAPTREPVLSLVGESDRWFQSAELRGDCAPFMDANDRSVVFRKPDPLHKNHRPTTSKRARRIVAEFLARHM